MKAVADERGWQHSSHRSLYAVARRISTERGIPEIRDLFQIESATHQNFYEGWLEEEDIFLNIAAIRRLLEILEIVPADNPDNRR